MTAETTNNDQALAKMPSDGALASQARNVFELTSANQDNNEDFPAIPIRLFGGLSQRATNIAITSRHTKPDEATMLALKAEAVTAAADEYAEPFDPTRFEADRLRQDEFERNKTELNDKAREAAQFAARELDEADETLARIDTSLQKPQTPVGWLVVGSLVLAVSIAPTLHDFIFASLDDELIKWLVSVLFATLFGGFISWGLVGNVESSGQRTSLNWGALVGGLLMGVGFGILRIAYAEGISEIGFAIALTVVELATVLMLEGKASSLRDAHHKFAEQQKAVTEATQFRSAKQQKQNRFQGRAKELEEKLLGHIRYIEERHFRSNIDRLKEAAEAAVISGYLAGVNANNAYLSGAERT